MSIVLLEGIGGAVRSESGGGRGEGRERVELLRGETFGGPAGVVVWEDLKRPILACAACPCTYIYAGACAKEEEDEAYWSTGGKGRAGSRVPILYKTDSNPNCKNQYW